MVAARLASVRGTWCVAGGWSIDLFLGTETRSHEDLEIATVRADLAQIRTALTGFVFHSVGSGEAWRLGPDEAARPDHFQHWVLDEQAQAWRVDVMVEPGDAQLWVYRRDESIYAPRDQMVGVTADGIPYLRPHGALFYKARSPRPKDEADFEAARDHLDEPDRAWLVSALARLHPDHPWLERLTETR
jgi:hypothetical protein